MNTTGAQASVSDAASSPIITLPDDNVHIIIRYIYHSSYMVAIPISNQDANAFLFVVSRFALTCKKWLQGTYTALNMVSVGSSTSIPIRLLGRASPKALSVSFEPADISEAEHVLFAQLLSSAREVYISGNSDWGRSDTMFLTNAEKVSLSECDPERFVKMISGAQASCLRSLCIFPMPSYQRLIEPLKQYCPSLTKLSLWSSLPEVDVKHFKSLSSLRRIKFHPTTHFNIMRLLHDNDFAEAVRLVDDLGSALPSHLLENPADVVFSIDLSHLVVRLDALLFLAASTPVEIDVALARYQPSDVSSTMWVLCLCDQMPTGIAAFETLVANKLHKLVKLGLNLFQPLQSDGTEEYTTFFHIAVARGSPAIVNALYNVAFADRVPAGAIEIVDSTGMTPLHYLPRHFEAWEACYKWHTANVPNWSLTDNNNRLRQSPCEALVPPNLKAHSNFVRIFAMLMVSNPTAIDMKIKPVAMCCALFNFFERWSQGLDLDFMKRDLVPIFSVEVVDFLPPGVPPLMAEFYLFLLDTCPNTFGRWASRFPVQPRMCSEILSVAVRRSVNLGFDETEWLIPILDTFFQVIREEHIDPGCLDSVVTCCVQFSRFEALSRCLTTYFGMHPVLSPTTDARKLFQSIFDREALENAHLLQCLPVLARRYLEKQRPELALHLLDGYIHACCDVFFDEADVSASTLPSTMKRALDDLCQAVLTSPSVSHLFDNTIYYDAESKESVDLTSSLWVILLCPLHIPCFDAETRLSKAQTLMAHMESLQTVTMSMFLSHDRLIFGPAAMTVVARDPELSRVIMEILPRLVSLFKTLSSKLEWTHIEVFWNVTETRDLSSLEDFEYATLTGIVSHLDKLRPKTSVKAIC